MLDELVQSYNTVFMLSHGSRMRVNQIIIQISSILAYTSEYQVLKVYRSLNTVSYIDMYALDIIRICISCYAVYGSFRIDYISYIRAFKCYKFIILC